MFNVNEYLIALEGGKLVGSKCKRCGCISIPLKPVCPKCGAFELEEIVAKGEGNLVSFTVIHVAPLRFEDKVPYVVGIVRLDEGPSIMSRLVELNPLEPETIKIGMRLRFSTLVENNTTIVVFKPI